MPQRATTPIIVAAVMLMLIATLGGWAGVTLLRKGPSVDDEIVASASAVKVTAIGILLACTLVLVAGIAAFTGSPEFLGTQGREFGTVTGRKRRCGWFDAVLVRQAVITSGIDGIALTKLDVLDGLERIRIAVGYRLDGKEIDYFPASEGAQMRVEPIYEDMEGWQDSTAGARTWNDLPAQAVKYVRHVEELIGAPVALLSTSPEREDTILVHDPFHG